MVHAEWYCSFCFIATWSLQHSPDMSYRTSRSWRGKKVITMVTINVTWPCPPGGLRREKQTQAADQHLNSFHLKQAKTIEFRLAWGATFVKKQSCAYPFPLLLWLLNSPPPLLVFVFLPLPPPKFLLCYLSSSHYLLPTLQPVLRSSLPSLIPPSPFLLFPLRFFSSSVFLSLLSLSIVISPSLHPLLHVFLSSLSFPPSFTILKKRKLDIVWKKSDWLAVQEERKSSINPNTTGMTKTPYQNTFPHHQAPTGPTRRGPCR